MARHSTWVRCGVVAAAGALALAAAPAALAAPSAAPSSAPAGTDAGLVVTYDAVGSSTVKKTGSVIALGPTTLTTNVAPDGSFTGKLPLPPQRTTFSVLGFVPVSATVNFVPAGGARQVSGQLKPKKVKSKARYYLKLTDVTVAGLPAFVGDSCQTAAPVVIPANTPEGSTFDLTTGGTLAGTYTITDFANCGLTTGIVNTLVPGDGNTMSITVSNGRLSG